MVEKASNKDRFSVDHMPYRGLMPYEEKDAAFFFGREKWRDIIINNLRASRLTVLYGGCGVGKSSVLRAGVVHTLKEMARQNQQRDGVPKVVVSFFNTWRDEPLNPLRQQIEQDVKAALGLPELESLSPALPLDQALLEWTRRLGGETVNGKLFIILDQFEEYSLYHNHESREGTFATEFPRVVNRPDLPVNFLISLRQDSLYRLDRFKETIPGLGVNRLQLEHLDEAAASDAIRKPVKEYNRQYRVDQPPISVEPTLVQQVLDQVRTGRLSFGDKGRGGVELLDESLGERPIEAPFLQMVMTRLWLEEMDAGSRQLRAETLNRLGGATQIVKEHLDARMGELRAEERDAAAHIFNYLVTPSGTKISQTVDDLVRYVNEEGEGSIRLKKDQVKSLLKDLCQGDSRILRPSTIETDPRERYEIFHDVLAEAILDWRRRYQETQKLEIERQKLQEQKLREAKKQRIAAQERQAKAERNWARALIAVGVICLVINGILLCWLVAKNRELRIKNQELRIKDQELRITEMNLEASESLVQLESDDALEALKKAMAVGQKVQDRHWSDRVPAATLALQQIVGQIHEKNLWLFSENNNGIPAPFGGVVQSSDGQWIAMRLLDGSRVYRWHLGSPGWDEVDLSLDDANDAIVSLDISNDGQRLVVATANGQIRVWNEDGGQVQDFPNKEPAKSFFGVRVRLSPDGQKLAVLNRDGFWLWEVDTKEPLASPWHDPNDQIMNVWFSPADHKIAIAGTNSASERFLALLDPDHQGHQVRFPISSKRPIRKLRFSPDGQKIATTAFGDKFAVLWDLQGQPLAPSKRAHQSAILSLSFSPDGQQLATGSDDGCALVWDKDGTKKWVFKGHDSEVAALGFSSDGEELTTVTSLGNVRLWSLAKRPCTEADQSCQILSCPDKGKGVSQFQCLTEVAFSKDGQLIVAGAMDGTAYLWKEEEGKTTFSRSFQGSKQNSFRTKAKVFLSPDGEQLATIASDGTARRWSISNEDSNPELLPVSPDEVALAIDLVTDSPKFVKVSKDGLLSILDFQGNVLTTIPVPDFSAQSRIRRDAVFSSNGQIIATISGNDNIPCLWDLKGRLLAEIKIHDDQVSVSNISFSPDGQKLAISFLDGTVKLSDLSGKSLLKAPINNGSSVVSVRFSPDGQTLATASLNGMARIWNLQGQQLAVYQSETGLWNASFRPFHGQLATMGFGDKVWLWSVYNLDQWLDQGRDWMKDYLATHPADAQTQRYD